MADYRRMYTTLFNEVTRTIERLQAVQQETEEMYLQNDNRNVRIIKPKNTEKK